MAKSPSRRPTLLIVLALAALACSGGLLVSRTPQAPAETVAAAPTVTRRVTRTATPVMPTITGTAWGRTPLPFPTRRVPATPTPAGTRPPSVTATGRATGLPTGVPVISAPVDPAPYAAGMLPAELDGIARLDDATVYTLAITIDWAGKTVTGREQVEYTNNETGPLDRLFLRLYPNAEHYREGQTDIAAVGVNGEPAEYSVDGTVLEVVLAEALAPEARAEVDLVFTVTVPENTDRFGWQDDVLSLGHWYPVMAVYDDEGWNLDPYIAAGDAFYSETAFYHVEVTALAGVVLATTGVETDERPSAGDLVTRTFVAPAVRDFAIAASPSYEVATREVNGTTVRSFYLPGDAAAGRRAADYGAQAVETYNELAGAYPYRELDIAETIFRIDDAPGGMEFPNLVFISNDFYRSGMYGDFHEIVLAHEIAHQWWYGVVGDNQVDEPWLDEAFATHASILYAYAVNGKSAGDAVLLEQAVAAYMVASGFGSSERPIASSLLDFDEDILTYQGFVYGKGAAFLHLLRERLGAETFAELLRAYYRDHRYGVLAPDAFRVALAGAADDPDVLAMYDSWVLTDEPHLEDALELVDIGNLP